MISALSNTKPRLSFLRVYKEWTILGFWAVFHSMMSGTAGSEILKGVFSTLGDGDEVVEF